MSKANTSPFTKSVVIAIVLLYAIGGVILFIQVGPWEAVRNVVINGLIVAAWLWSAAKVLRGDPAPGVKPVRYPLAELAWTLVTLLVVVGLAVNGYAGWLPIPSWTLSTVAIAAVLILFIGLRYPIHTLGIAWPSKRGWLALLVAILINFAAAALFQVLPRDILETGSPGDLAAQITGPVSVIVLLVGLLFRAALPEELLLRVTLQPRLARFLPLGWAILIQALLFSLGHLPQRLIGYQEPLTLALGYLLTVDNGLIAGYLWYRTRSLPLLLILHLFAFPRLGI
ncbi:MAG: CPBP family intramembrane metalloprotease [Anaerolineales bacterium]|jgi:membrane protease YdiL (CAAX protease family)